MIILNNFKNPVSSNILSSEEEEQSHFQKRRRDAYILIICISGVVKDYGRTGYVRTPVKSPSNIPESTENDENEISDEGANNEAELKVGVTTTTEVPEQIGHAEDDSVEVTTSPTVDNVTQVYFKTSRFLLIEKGCKSLSLFPD